MAEFNATNTAIKHIEYRIEKGDSNNPELYEYFRERLLYKKQVISYQAQESADVLLKREYQKKKR